MDNFSTTGWLFAIFCCLIIGMSKCGMSGLTSLAVPLMASIMPAKAATGAILPLLILGDLLGALYFKRHANLKILLRLMPIAFLGILLGYILLGCSYVDDKFIRIATGVIVITMVAMNSCSSFIHNFLHTKELPANSESSALPPSNNAYVWAMAIIFGIAAGFTTMLANAAGPVVMIYLLFMKLPKNEFIGTSAWYFLVLNWVKVPFMIEREMITLESLKFNLKLAPVIMVGAILGVIISKRMSNDKFKKYIQILTVVSAALLLLPSGFITGLLK